MPKSSASIIKEINTLQNVHGAQKNWNLEERNCENVYENTHTFQMYETTLQLEFQEEI